jgi:NADPH-dependent 2,4-dienoyl-CoA reductase/sulfur reductase-like enzyme
MHDTFALTAHLNKHRVTHAVIIGGGYLGLEMAEALTIRGLHVTVLEQLPQLLARTLDPQLATHVEAELRHHGVQVHTLTAVRAVEQLDGRLRVHADHANPQACDLLLVVAGVRPDSALAAAAGIQLGTQGAIAVDRRTRTNVPHVWAAGDCVETYHRLLARNTYLPLGTTAHKQGRVAGENALGGDRLYGGSLGTQVVKVFDLVVAATGLRDHEAAGHGFQPRTVEVVTDDHKAYYRGATPISIRVTTDTQTRRLLGAQLVGRRGAEIAKRVDIYATAIHHGAHIDDISDLDLSYTPPLGSPWDAVQTAAHEWTRQAAEATA